MVALRRALVTALLVVVPYGCGSDERSSVPPAFTPGTSSGGDSSTPTSGGVGGVSVGGSTGGDSLGSGGTAVDASGGSGGTGAGGAGGQPAMQGLPCPAEGCPGDTTCVTLPRGDSTLSTCLPRCAPASGNSAGAAGAAGDGAGGEAAGGASGSDGSDACGDDALCMPFLLDRSRGSCKPKCVKDSDCQQGFSCSAAGACECDTDDACESWLGTLGYSGEGFECRSGACRQSCAADEGCACGTLCTGGYCEAGCETDADCCGDGRCADGRCTLAPGDAGAHCHEPDDCTGGLDCYRDPIFPRGLCSAPSVGATCGSGVCAAGFACGLLWDELTQASLAGCLPRCGEVLGDGCAEGTSCTVVTPAGGACTPGCKDDAACGPDGRCLDDGTCGCTSKAYCMRFDWNAWCDTTTSTCACARDCRGRVCGSDGCGGSCGTCGPGLACDQNSGSCGGTCDLEETPFTVCDNGALCPSHSQCDAEGTSCSCDSGFSLALCDGSPCQGSACNAAAQGYTCRRTDCTASCKPMQCGDDSCGTPCPYRCAAGTTCNNGTCACVPSCSGACGGADGCGGTCKTGTCPTGEVCQNGTCLCPPSCDGKACGADDGCGHACQTGSCASGLSCVGGSCQCIPKCSVCGEADGCGGTCQTGSCASGLSCVSGSCQCVPKCSGKQCGDDGCGGVCGTCGALFDCVSNRCTQTRCYDFGGPCARDSDCCDDLCCLNGAYAGLCQCAGA